MTIGTATIPGVATIAPSPPRRPEARPTTPTAAPRRLPHLGNLDGLRALAVVAVLLYHAEVAGVPGGFLGVEVFFVLSGYLVTLLLWGRWRGGDADAPVARRLDLRSFWVARARRLVPANLALLGAVGLALALAWPAEAARVRGELVASLGYVSNWYLIATDRSYFAAFGRPSPVRHLWSLAVEAQFYLAWPLVLGGLAWGLRSARRVALTTLGLAAASAALALALYHPGDDPSRVYYGTDTRAAGLLLGAALALLWRPFDHAPAAAGDRRWLRVGLVEAGTVVGLGGLLVAFATVDELADRTYEGGLLAVSVVSALVVAVAADPGARLARALLGGAVAQAIGRRSYGLYLWHWPVFCFLRPGFEVGWSSGPTLVARLAVTAALAELSYRFVELPVRRGLVGRLVRRVRGAARRGDRARRRQLVTAWAGLAGAGALTVGVLAALLAAADEPPPPFDPTARVVALGGGPLGAAGPSSAAGTATAAGTAAAAVGADAGEGAEPTTTDAPTTDAPTTDAPPATSPAVEASGPATTASPTTAPAPPPAEAPTTAPTAAPPVAPASGGGTFALGDSVMLSAAPALEAALPGIAIDATVSRQVGEGVAALVAWRAAGGQAPVVVVHLGNNGQFHGGQVDEVMAALGPATRVVFVNVRVPTRWEDQVNWSLGEVVPRYPNARLVDWHAASRACPPGSFADDGVHLVGDGGACYAALIRAAAVSP